MRVFTLPTAVQYIKKKVRAIPRETLKNKKISNAVFVIETYTSRNLIH